MNNSKEIIKSIGQGAIISFIFSKYHENKNNEKIESIKSEINEIKKNLEHSKNNRDKDIIQKNE